MQKIKAKLIADNEYMVLTGPNKEKSIVYAVNLGNSTYAYLNTSLEDLGTTTAVLRGQLIYITIIVIILAIIISLFLSNKISQPILEITEKSQELAKGNYDVEFPKNGIVEIDELAETLNYLESEVSKTDQYRRDAYYHSVIIYIKCTYQCSHPKSYFEVKAENYL